MVERRATKRIPLRRAAWIVGTGGKKAPCILADISLGGAQIALVDRRRVADAFVLSFDNRSLPARVVWCGVFRMGVQFQHWERQLAA
jgi:hypothetical protein